MTTPISSTNPSNDHTANIANQLEGLRVSGEPENIAAPEQSIIAAAWQEHDEAMKAECEAFTRDLSSQLAGMRQRLVAEIEENGRARSAIFAPLRDYLDNSQAEFEEQMRVLRERLDKIG
jgi:hypothetical protein